MLRKQIRVRKEYLHQKEQENQKKKELQQSQPASAIPTNTFDSEYALATYQDPLILVTTSRDPSERLKRFHKEMTQLFPNSMNLPRGALKVKDLLQYGLNKSFSDIVIIHEQRGEPDGLILTHLPNGPTSFFGLSNVVLRHDAENTKGLFSQAYPHMIFHNFNENKVGKRIQTILQHLFPVPNNQESKRIVSFIAENDFVSFRHHNYVKTDHKTVDLIEVGPRFEMRPYMIKLGNLMQANATIEWSLKPHLNTATKNKQISND